MAAIVGGNDNSNRNAVSVWWSDFTRFLSDVRGETRKLVTPSREEVQATTTVVIAAVILFGVFFFVTDQVFSNGLKLLLSKLTGTH